jgi:uncharacterized repeat protein (TIGR01451 family)
VSIPKGLTSMKISRRTAPAQATAALAIGLIAIPAAMTSGHPVASHKQVRPPQTPGLTVSVSDGRVAARAGDELTYTVTVRDTGTVAAPHLTVTQTMSPGLKFLSASDHGAVAGGQVAWTAGLPVGGTRTFRVVTRVTETPATLLRLAAVACVTLPGSRSPIVCASHLDRLPAAAEAAAGSGRSGVPGLVYAAAGLGALVLGLLGAVAFRRRGLVQRQPG